MLGCTGISWGIVGFAEVYWDVLGYAGMCQDKLQYIGVCWDVQHCAQLQGRPWGTCTSPSAPGPAHVCNLFITGTCPLLGPAHHLDLPTTGTCPSLALGKGDEQQFVRVPSVWKILHHCHTQCMKHCKSKLNYFQSHALRFAVNSSEDSRDEATLVKRGKFYWYELLRKRQNPTAVIHPLLLSSDGALAAVGWGCPRSGGVTVPGGAP